MNYGGWGPRFASSAATQAAPDGDWMLSPELWTHGIPSNHQGSAGPDAAAAARPASPERRRRRHRMATALSAFAVTLATVHTVAWTVATCVLRKETIRVLLQTRSNCILWVAANAILSLFLTNVVVAQRLIVERMNRRSLWSHRRTLVTIGAASILW